MMESKTISETIQSNKRKRKRNSNKIEYARDTEREGERERGRQVGIKIKPRFWEQQDRTTRIPKRQQEIEQISGARVESLSCIVSVKVFSSIPPISS
jgi:hypothetical protein